MNPKIRFHVAFMIVLSAAGAVSRASQTEDEHAARDTATSERSDHPAKSLTAQASDPTAPLIQLQFTNFYAPASFDGDGYSNFLFAEPVIPVPPFSGFPLAQVMRLTVPLVTTADPGRTSGLGDLSFFDLFVPKARSWGIWGAGVSLVLPTAVSEELGSGKWQLGPAFTTMYYGISSWQIGVVVQNPVSLAGDAARPSVNALLVQPIVNYLMGAWYFGVGDFNWQFDWTEGGVATIPLAFQAGYVTKIGKFDYNFSAEVEWTAVRPEGVTLPKWGIRLGFVLLLPEA